VTIGPLLPLSLRTPTRRYRMYIGGGVLLLIIIILLLVWLL
jgi:hypothetical protein